MLEVMQFVFSSFWVWLGTLTLVCAFGQSLGVAIRLWRRR
jgi:hypothetical protein